MMANRPWSEDLIDYLGVYLQDNKYDLQKLLEHVMTSRACDFRDDGSGFTSSED